MYKIIIPSIIIMSSFLFFKWNDYQHQTIQEEIIRKDKTISAFELINVHNNKIIIGDKNDESLYILHHWSHWHYQSEKDIKILNHIHGKSLIEIIAIGYSDQKNFNELFKFQKKNPIFYNRTLHHYNKDVIPSKIIPSKIPAFSIIYKGELLAQIEGKSFNEIMLNFPVISKKNIIDYFNQ